MMGNLAVNRLLQTCAEQCDYEQKNITAPHFGDNFSRISVTDPKASAIQAKLAINKPGDANEQEADRIASQVMKRTESRLQYACIFDGMRSKYQTEGDELLQTNRVVKGNFKDTEALPITHHVLSSGGQSLDLQTRDFMEPRFGLNINGELDPNKWVDFSQVRVHTDTNAASSAQAIGALAYTSGNDIVFNIGQYAPGTYEGRSLLAHELAHVVQQKKEIRRYRNKGAFNFGKLDDATHIEDSFYAKRDKETKPWIKLITINFDSMRIDADGNKYSSGTASAQYYDNSAKLPNFSFAVGGGSRTLGRTDSGTFTVWRIEGIGYNSGIFSGQPGIDFDPTEREGPRIRYSKDLESNMSFAIFYNRGEALHAGPLEFSSHGCVHVDWTEYDTIKQLNYHSVVGLTKVKVKYLSKKEREKRVAE